MKYLKRFLGLFKRTRPRGTVVVYGDVILRDPLPAEVALRVIDSSAKVMHRIGGPSLWGKIQIAGFKPDPNKRYAIQIIELY